MNILNHRLFLLLFLTLIIILINSTAFLTQKSIMVTKVRGNIAVVDHGRLNGLKKGDVYAVIRVNPN